MKKNKKTRLPPKAPHQIISVKRAPNERSRALVTIGPRTIRAAIGRSGLTVRKHEGDGATPVATMRLLYGFVRRDRVSLPPTRLPLRSTRKGMLWCDQPDSPNYNRPVRAPFMPSHEEMMRADGLYDVCLVLDWNIGSRRRNRGSAIFFHLIKPGYPPTAGCIAVDLPDMRWLLRFIGKETVVVVS